MPMLSTRLSSAVVATIALATLTVFAVRPAISQDGDKNPVITKYADIDMRSLLTEMKLKFKESKDEDDLVVFDVDIDGTEMNIYQYTGAGEKIIDSLSFSVGYDLEKGMDMRPINEFNSRNRFVKAYLDEENDPFLVCDIRVKEGVTRETLKETIKSYISAVGRFESALSGDE